MSYPKATPRPPTLFSDFKYPMPRTAKPMEGQKYPATWNWEISGQGNKVFFKVTDGLYGSDDPNRTLKQLDMNIFERNGLFAVLEEAITDPEFKTAQYPVVRQYIGDKYYEVPATVATFTVIRRKDGTIRVHYRRSSYEAVFLMSSVYLRLSVRNEENEFIEDKGFSSRAYTRAFVEACRHLDTLEVAKYERKKKGDDDDDDGGSRGGRGGRSGGGGGGNSHSRDSQKFDDFDDDDEDY